MPPHLFHSLSDDPSSVFRKQIGCMSAFFHMFDHPLKPALASTSFNSSAPKPSSSTSKDSGKSRKHHRKNGFTPERSCHKQITKGRTAEESSPAAGHHNDACITAGRSNSSKTVRPFSWYIDGHPKLPECSRNSPSILDSSRSTAAIREPPRKSFDASDLKDPNRRSRLKKPPTGSSHSISRGSMRPHVDQRPRGSLDGREISRHSFDPRRRDLWLDASCKDPLDDLKESLRTLAKLQQATQDLVDSFEAPRSSVDWIDKIGYRAQGSPGPAYDGGEGARSSSFDYTEAIRISQKFQEATGRHSLDGREIPKSVLRLREAMKSRLAGWECTNDESPSITPVGKQAVSSRSSRRSTSKSSRQDGIHRPNSNVIARLMGLEDLPTAESVGKPINAARSIKPLVEAKSLKELLHNTQANSGKHSRVRECDTTKEGQAAFQNAEKQRHTEDFDDELKAATRGISSKDTAKIGGMLRPTEENWPSLINNRDANLLKNMDTPKHAFEIMPSCVEKRRARDANKHNQPSSHTTQPMTGFEDELQRRMKQLGTAQINSLTERKSLKEIIEAMHLKGLLHSPEQQQPEAVKDLRECDQKLLDKQAHQLQTDASLGIKPANYQVVPTDSVRDYKDGFKSSSQRADPSHDSSSSGGRVLCDRIVIMKPRMHRASSMQAHDHSISISNTKPRVSRVERHDTCKRFESDTSRRSNLARQHNACNKRRLPRSMEDNQINGGLAIDGACVEEAETNKNAVRKQSPSPIGAQSTGPCPSSPRKGSPPKGCKVSTRIDGNDSRRKLEADRAHSSAIDHATSSQTSSRTTSSPALIKKSVRKIPVLGASDGTRGRVEVATESPRDGQKLQVSDKNHRKSRGDRCVLGSNAEVCRPRTVLEFDNSVQDADGCTKPNRSGIGSGLVTESCHYRQQRESKDSTPEERKSHPTAEKYVGDGRTSCKQEMNLPFIELNLTSENQHVNKLRHSEVEIATLLEQQQLVDNDTQTEISTSLQIGLPIEHPMDAGITTSMSLQHSFGSSTDDACSKESSELRSPISVLDSRYDDNDLSPPHPTLKKKLLYGNGDDSIPAKESNGCGIHEEQDPAAHLGCSEFEYVHAILSTAGLLAGKLDTIPAAWISPAVFFQLERTWDSSGGRTGVNGTPELSRLHRKLIFAGVDEILAGKLTFELPLNRTWSGQELVCSVWRDLQRRLTVRTPGSCGRGLPAAKGDCIYDILQNDLELSGSWRKAGGVVCDVAFDLEHMILTDLLFELQSELMS